MSFDGWVCPVGGAETYEFVFSILAAVLYCVHGLVSSIANKRCLHHRLMPFKSSFIKSINNFNSQT